MSNPATDSQSHFDAARLRLIGFARRNAVELYIALAVAISCAYFFQGGGWNQNAHFASVVSLVENGTWHVDPYRASTGDLAHAAEEGHVASCKAAGTPLAALPGYTVARTLTLGVDNHGNRVIARAYLTAFLTAGLALIALAILLYRLLRRRLEPRDAAMLALAVTLATPLLPNSTMLNSSAMVSLCALAAYALLEQSRLNDKPLSARRLLAAGLLAALPTTFEYMTVAIVLPLGVYALWQCRPRWRVVFFIAGGAIAALIPLAHHTIVFGHPLHPGQASLVLPRFVHEAQQGFFGFDGLSFARLYELTLGTARGCFFLSPFLLAAVPGWVRMLRDRTTRAEGLVTAGVCWIMILLTASLIHWHSGSSMGSRYILLFGPFAAIPIAVMLPRHRGWIAIGMGVAFALILLATSVTAIPPTPPAHPPYPNVIGWYWERFSIGNLASWQQHVLVEQGIGTGNPTMPFSFNLGQLIGLPGLWSLSPFCLVMGIIGWRLLRVTKPA